MAKTQLGELIKVSSGQGLTATEMRGGEFPVYGGNGINGYHDEGSVEPDTIVIGRVGAYCGAVHTTRVKCWVTDNALIVRKLQDINTTYLAAALTLAELNQYAGRAAQPLVSGSRIYPIEIIVPAMDEQVAFEKAVKSAFSQEHCLKAGAAKLETLFASLQHRAFRGEL